MIPKSTHIQSAQVVSGIEQTVVHVPRLTVKKLADKLVSIEKEKGYEIALLGVESLDYVKICHLAVEKHPDNDPHLMPSRFMILYGATDEGLKKNLDRFPYAMVGDGKPKMSVAKLGMNLATIGWYPCSDDDLQEPQDDTEDGNEAEDPTALKGTIFGALCAYIEAAAPATKRALMGGTHVVQAGECLSDIAELHGIREWRLLWQLNKGKLGENWDLLKEGMELALPDDSHNPLVDWFRDNGWGDYLNPAMGYQYPGKYLSLTFVDQDDKPLAFDAPLRCEVYVATRLPSLVFAFDLKGGDDFDVVVPDTEEIGVWVEGEEISYRGIFWPRFEEFQANPGRYLSTCEDVAPVTLPIRRADKPDDQDDGPGSGLRDAGHEAMDAYRGARDETHDAAQAGRDMGREAQQTRAALPSTPKLPGF